MPLLIPGCGSGYEALYLLQKGFSQITMLDIAQPAIDKLETMLDAQFPSWRTSLKAEEADFFGHQGQYAYVLEQTFFCAISPAMREAYVTQMHKLLQPNGILAGVLFNRIFEGGPPFSGNIEEYIRIFAPYFEIMTLEPCYNSIPSRAGTEVFIQFRAK
jgi:methyl halide transferase